jgi:pimeloyl-ACP methyl ester carboxylesterase
MTAIADRFEREGTATCPRLTQRSQSSATTTTIPNAQLQICPDAGHGFLNQCPELFADHVNAYHYGG